MASETELGGYDAAAIAVLGEVEWRQGKAN